VQITRKTVSDGWCGKVEEAMFAKFCHSSPHSQVATLHSIQLCVVHNGHDAACHVGPLVADDICFSQSYPPDNHNCSEQRCCQLQGPRLSDEGYGGTSEYR